MNRLLIGKIILLIDYILADLDSGSYTGTTISRPTGLSVHKELVTELSIAPIKDKGMRSTYPLKSNHKKNLIS